MSKSFDWKSIDTSGNQVAVITGANIGLGYDNAWMFAKKGVNVIMACRDEGRAKEAMNKIRSSVENAKLDFIPLDLGSLKSVKAFAETFLKKYDRLDWLINNAGIMMPPYGKTIDGFESQLGVNYLGHFYLTGLLLDVLNATDGSRVISLSSIAHRWGDIYLDDPHFDKGYDARKAYGQSKLACLMFSYELQRRLEESGSGVKSLAAHPGISQTNLSRNMSSFAQAMGKVLGPFLLQSSARGALPTMRAALDPSVKGGEYFGPGGFREFKGDPVQVHSNSISHNKDLAAKLWKFSEEAVGFGYLGG